MASSHSLSKAALTTLLVLQLTMLFALFTQTDPHPPLRVPFFALGPFLGASLALAASALVLGGPMTNGGAMVSLLAGLTALVSYGPQKWFNPAIGEIWPAVLLGQLAAALLLVQAFRGLRRA